MTPAQDCCCSVTESCPTLCNPMDCSTPGLRALHCLLGFAQTHIHQVSDAILPSLPLSPSSPACDLSQHQGIFQWVGSSCSGGQSIGTSASVLPINLQCWFPLGLPWCSDWFDLLAVQRWVLVAQSCPTLCSSMDCSLSGFSVHRIFQAIIPEWVSFSRGSSQPRDWTHVSCVSCIAGRFFIHWAIGEACSEIPRF